LAIRRWLLVGGLSVGLAADHLRPPDTDEIDGEPQHPVALLLERLMGFKGSFHQGSAGKGMTFIIG